MPENILVVEYEPRYTDRVKQALTGQPFTPSFAHDGEEAIRALDAEKPRLIVLSSIVPKISTSDLIKAIRERKALQSTPILLTVSGYVGRTPKQDAEKLGASDILPKPYSEIEFLGKVNEMIGAQGHLTSNDIFGEILDEKPAAGRKPMKPTDDVDKLLEETLHGMMPRRKDTGNTSPGTTAVPKTTAPGTEQKPKAQPGGAELDKLLQDTLSGLEKKKTATKTPAPPNVGEALSLATPAGEPAPRPAAEKVLVSQPVVAPPPVPAPVEEKEEEPVDGIRYGQYVLLEKIATGGMAEVWKARMRGVEGFQKIVAIKKILPHLSDNQEFIEMFIDEAKLAAQLTHNNIIHIYDLGKTQGTYFIAMEYVDGHDLKTILKRGSDRDQPLGIELSLFIASKIAAALDYAHRRRDFEEKEMGLVHRDVSPQNVLISQEGDIKLCDFGIAKAASKASHTQAGALKGKLQYMSPEQAWGKPIDRRSDIFALATVLFEMLTGRKLFTGENEISILEQVREARVTAPSEINDEVTPEIDAIVLKALNKEPAARYQTAGEMARDIDSVLYSMRPTPTSADLAIYMHRIWTEDPSRQVEPESAPTVVDVPVTPVAAASRPAPVAAGPAVAAAPAASAAVQMPPWEAPAKKKSMAPIAIAAVVVIALAIGGFAIFRSKSSPAPAVPAATARPPVAASTVAPPPATSSVATETGAQTTTALTSTAATATQAPVIDPAQVDAEVQRRIAAERARLEEQARAQQQAQNTPAPQPRPAPVQTASQAPAPVIPAPAPAPATQTVAPPPAPAPVTVQESAPQQAATPEPPPRAKLGDLVQPGTEGLTPARITRQAAATYPPIARIERMQGSVVVSVLVSETGQVMETRILSGGSGRTAILNDAAVQAIRRSVFAPGTKDGVRVKSWTTVRIDFKL